MKEDLRNYCGGSSPILKCIKIPNECFMLHGVKSRCNSGSGGRGDHIHDNFDHHHLDRGILQQSGHHGRGC